MVIVSVCWLLWGLSDYKNIAEGKYPKYCEAKR